MERSAHLRVARETADIAAITRFYCDGLGFEVIGSFADHDGFDGVMFGHPELGYHLEFTRRHGHPAGRAPSTENLLVFYLPDQSQWRNAVQHMIEHGYEPVPSSNPFWETKGKTFEDPDGYRVVLQNAGWES